MCTCDWVNKTTWMTDSQAQTHKGEHGDVISHTDDRDQPERQGEVLHIPQANLICKFTKHGLKHGKCINFFIIYI